MRLERLSRTRRRKGASVYTRSEECHRRKYATESSYRPRILDPTSLGNVHRFRSYSYFLFLSWWSFTGNRYLNTNAAESHGAIGQGNTNRGREERGAWWGLGTFASMEGEGNRQMYAPMRSMISHWGKNSSKIYRF